MVQIDGTSLKLYRQLLALELLFEVRSGAKMQPLHESWHHYDDVERMP
jgi:hypothetical protein